MHINLDTASPKAFPPEDEACLGQEQIPSARGIKEFGFNSTNESSKPTIIAGSVGISKHEDKLYFYNI